MSRMHQPPHPGEVLQGLYMEPLEMTIAALSRHIGVERKALSRLINGHTGVTVEMALRLGKAFNTSPETWLTIQQAYDLWQIRKNHAVDVSDIASLNGGQVITK